MPKSRSTSHDSNARIKYVCLALFAVGVLLLAYIAFAKVDSSGAAPGATPNPVPTFGSLEPQTPDNLAALETAINADAKITVYALGSSVGVGATLTDPGTEAPSAYLTGKLGELSSGGAELTNLSVNGSVAVDGVAIYRDQVKPAHPTVLLLTYGMNDGMAANYNSGETLPGGIDAVRTIADEARADGTTVLLATTPSPDTEDADFSLPEGFAVAYPEANGPAAPENPLTTVNGAPFSARHAEWNQDLGDVASQSGVALIDVVPAWTAAVASDGEGVLFNEGEFVHPNLLGHQNSYWAAIDSFVDSLE